MFNLVELRKLATDKKYSTVRVASKELLSLINEIELLREQLFNAEQQIYRVEKEQLATVKEHDELLAALDKLARLGNEPHYVKKCTNYSK